ncbi:MAG: SdpI family protein [Pseudomonadota bacterium]
MTSKTADRICGVLVLLITAAGIAAYPTLPEQVPFHWNAAGEVDGFSSRLTAVLFGPALAVFTWLLIRIIPSISPRGYRTDGFQDVLAILQVAMVAFMVGLGTLILLSAKGVEISMERSMPIAVGLLFALIGNYLGKVRKNFFIGIRTPWTLASDEVWARTHRLGGYLFVACGIALVGCGALGINTALFVGIPLIAAVTPVVYSYVAYRNLEGFD